MKFSKLALIIAGAALLAVGIYNMNGTLNVPPHVVASFEQWTVRHNRNYASPSEKVFRLAVFYSNYKKVASQNANPTKTWSAELNHFADMTPAEFKTKMLGFRFTTTPKNYASVSQKFTANPTSVDWRTKGIVNPVKNQGQCGSCWAFSTVTSIESAQAQASGNLASYAEQQLVDCSTSYGNHGCNGGLMDYGFNYVKDHGLTLESNYPYTAQDGNCKSSAVAEKKVTLTGHTDIPQNGQKLEDNSVNVVVSVACDAMNWSFYSGGIFDNCGTSLDHGIAVVGYGADGSSPYWIVRNSWGASWGEKGYIRLKKTLGTDAGTCGINMAASFPTGVAAA